MDWIFFPRIRGRGDRESPETLRLFRAPPQLRTGGLAGTLRKCRRLSPRHAEADRSGRCRRACRSVESGQLGRGRVEAGLQSLDLASPSVAAGLTDTFAQIGDYLNQASASALIDAQHWASNTCVLMAARRPIRAATVAEFELAVLEVLLEFGPFGVGRFAVFLGGSAAATGIEVGAVRADQVVLENGMIGLRSGDAGMAEQLRRDVDRQTAGDRLGDEHSAEVVRCCVDLIPSRVADLREAHASRRSLPSRPGLITTRRWSRARWNRNGSGAVQIRSCESNRGTSGMVPLLLWRRRAITVASTLASSGLTSSSRSWLLLDRTICNSGTTSPVSGIRWLTKAR